MASFDLITEGRITIDPKASFDAITERVDTHIMKADIKYVAKTKQVVAKTVQCLHVIGGAIAQATRHGSRCRRMEMKARQIDSCISEKQTMLAVDQESGSGAENANAVLETLGASATETNGTSTFAGCDVCYKIQRISALQYWCKDCLGIALCDNAM